MPKEMNSKEALRILSECANGEKKLLFSDSLDLERIIRQDLDRKDKKYLAYRISMPSTLPPIVEENGGIMVKIQENILVEKVKKIDKEIIDRFTEIAKDYGINELLLLNETEIKMFFKKYLPIYIKERGLDIWEIGR